MEQLPYQATIAPLPEAVERPLWSVMIPTYNCAGYLRETLASVLAQAPGPEIMQIEVVDDCSTKDDPSAVVEELGKGRVGFYRQSQNVGNIHNFNTCLQRSKGILVHVLHGDDCVRNGFYRHIQQAFDEKPEIGAAFCRSIKMDENGHWKEIEVLLQNESGTLDKWIDQIATAQLISNVSIVVARKVYEQIGGFDKRLCWAAEDWEMWVRIAAYYPVWYEPEPLAIRRRHSASMTTNTRLTGKYIQNIRTAIEITKQYLPAESANKLSKAASINYAFHALDIAKGYAELRKFDAATNQIREALLCSSSLKVILSSLKLLTYVLYVAMMSVLRPKNNTSAV